MKKMIQVIAIAVMAVAAGPLAAQPNWKVDFRELTKRAAETVEVNLDGKMLRLATAFLSTSDAEEREIREIVAGLSGIYIRSFTFSRDWDYDKAIAEAVRKQIGSGWEKIITVRSRTSEDLDVYVRPGATALEGIFIIAAEPREFTIVNIVGSIDIDKLGRLEGQFGIPKLEIESESKVERRVNR